MQVVRLEKDFWLAFQILKRELGPASYTATIREAMAVSDRCVVPKAYKQLWAFNTAGILNLNLDRLASRSHSSERPGANVELFDGASAGRYTHLINSSNPFIANLHGNYNDAESWVFTKDSLSSLLRRDAYQTFMRSCFAAHTVVFCGISADDVAVGGFLSHLKSSGVDTGQHFWITNRSDTETIEWAESAGLQVILYRAENGDHTGLNKILQVLGTAVPDEPSPTPVIASKDLVLADDSLALEGSPSEVEMWDPEKLRGFLNFKATELLNADSDGSFREYGEFCRAYDAAIHRAWYAKPETERDTLFGFKLLREVGLGGFGTVYEAISPDGNRVAVKLLHEAIRNDAEKLHSFRRGVSSMKILDRRNVSGVVTYRMAAEIPAFAVMDFIDGDNLANAVIQRGRLEWIDVLTVMKKIVSIIRAGHQLPERVLHRDIRPHNIMIPNSWEDPTDWDVKILDFDLSWHRDAIEMSVQDPNASNGYLPPEMIYRKQGVSTRSALVDSYGLGTTLYFLCTKEDPKPMEPVLADWEQTVARKIAGRTAGRWQSLPRRLARLVRNSTKEKQADRIDVVQFESELTRMLVAEETPNNVRDVDFWAEELAKRSSDLPFTYDSKSGEYVFTLGGLGVRLSCSAIEDEIDVHLDWKAQGGEHYKDVRKWIGKIVDQINAAMKRGGWRGKVEALGYQSNGKFSINTASLRSNCETLSQSLREAIEIGQFNG